ncbi:MAG: MBL fold metallo-hydrolase [Syntrophomonadaceae bacterium]|jgi:glyoxylase-like metal-dependent hydrolase (beta-lactamase superfamily II)|nr:MBL fold metallo-hydrolase [Syntrophomonadaceae bacterium]
MQITEHVHTLKIPFKVQINAAQALDRFAYVYLIYGQRVYLVDTGVSGSEQAIFDYLKKTGWKPKDIDKIILTHSHPDHIGAALAIKEASSCSVLAHRDEIDWIEDLDKQYRERTLFGFHSLVGGAVKVDQLLQNGDIINLEPDLELEVIHTPGHSRGSISLFLRPDGALFSGDVVPLTSDVPIYDDFKDSLESIKLLRNLSGVEVLLSAWDEPRHADSAYKAMEAGLAYLEHIHQVVADNADSYSEGSEPRWCRNILEEVGIPPAAANPLVGRSFKSHLKLLSNSLNQKKHN